MSDKSPILTEAARSVINAASPGEAADRALSGLHAALDVKWSALYFLDRSSGFFVNMSRRGSAPADYAKAHFSHPALQPDGRPGGKEGPSLTQKHAQLGEVYLAIEPISLGSEVVGILYFGSDGPIPSSLSTGLDTLLTALTASHERASLIRALEELGRPIRYRQGAETFVAELLELTLRATDMEFALLRELQATGDLHATAQVGLQQHDVDTFDILAEDADNLTSAVTEGRMVFVSDALADEEAVSRHLRMPRSEWVTIRSVVLLPLTVGDEIVGVMSLGSRIPYKYSPIDARLFGAVATIVSSQLVSQRLANEAEDRLLLQAESSVAITALEIAQSARHEAKSVVGNAHEILALMRARIRKNDPASIGDLVDHLDEVLGYLDPVMEKLRASTRPPMRVERSVAIQEVFAEACSQLLGRIASLKVRTSCETSPVRVTVQEDWFRQVFLNLLLNSLDAFDETRATHKRRDIRVGIGTVGPRDRNLRIRFFDTATGIQYHRILHSDNVNLDPRRREAIFEPGVTSKASGSGWGLALCRRIMADHGGSIQLLDSRGGATF